MKRSQKRALKRARRELADHEREYMDAVRRQARTTRTEARAATKAAKGTAAKMGAAPARTGKRDSYRDVDALLRRTSKMERKRVEAWMRGIEGAKCAQDMLGYTLMYEDGIAETSPGTFTETIRFTDMNYRTASMEDQRSAFEAWCALLNYFTPQVELQLSAISCVRDDEAYMRRMMLDETGAPWDAYIREYNQMLIERARESTQGIARARYLTVSVKADDRKSAIPLLARVRDDVTEMLRRMGCRASKLTGAERCALLRSQIAPYDELDFDYGRGSSAKTSKDAVAPAAFDFSYELDREGRFFAVRNAPESRDVYAQALVVQEWPSDLSDRALSTLTDLPIPLNVSVHYHPYEQTEAVALVLKKLAFMRGEKSKSQQEAFRRGLDPELGVSLEVQHRESEADDLLDDLRNRNQHLFSVSVVVYVWGRSLDELSSRVYQVTSAARKMGIRLASYPLRQKQAFNTALPLGVDHVRIDRTMTTAEAAVLLPFSTQELMERGMYYGQNQLSGNPILFDRKSLKTPAGFIFGKPGSGKSMNNKGEMFNTRFGNPDDHMIVIDPKGEYGVCIQAWGGEAFELAVDSPHHLNIFDLTADYSGAGNNPVLFKTEFLIAFFSEVLSGGGAISPIERSILDRCIRAVYAGWRPDTPLSKMPTLVDFWEVLRSQPDDEADSMARALEMYVHGTLSCFSHTTDIEADAQWVSWSTKRMGPQLAMAGTMAVMDRAWLHVTDNERQGLRTWVYIDEIQNFETNGNAMAYLQKYYAEGRSYGLIPTGITQHPDRILRNDTFRQMLSSCEFQVLLDQSYSNREHLREILALSDTELGYVKDAEPGCGLLVAGSAIVPFRNIFPKNTELYRLMTTDPSEREAEAKMRRMMGGADGAQG